METQAILLAIEILALAIKKEPEIEALILDWMKKDNPTLEERAAFRARLELTTYQKLVPHSKLPPGELADS